MLHSALPVYEVQFIPVEQRLLSRRMNQVRAADWPKKKERRSVPGRRAEDFAAA
jgi:hypothetical protein